GQPPGKRASSVEHSGDSTESQPLPDVSPDLTTTGLSQDAVGTSCESMAPYTSTLPLLPTAIPPLYPKFKNPLRIQSIIPRSKSGLLVYSATVKGTRFRLLVDGGAEENFVSSSLIQRLDLRTKNISP